MTSTEEIYKIYEKHPTVTTDSRRIAPGSIFFALRGDTFDGNNYAAASLEAGAAYCVVDRADAANDKRCLLVENVLTALQELARFHRRRLGIPIISITGSNGKTTTKELLARVLSKKQRVAYTQGNLNNHIGVPLTLLSIGSDVEIGIVEMGANHCGEIALLASIAEPDIGLITNIGKAHLEGFGGVEGVMRGKGELFDFLATRGGRVFYMAESEPLSKMAAARPSLNATPYDTSEFKILNAPGEFLKFEFEGQTVQTSLVGDYNIYNVAAAVNIGFHLGVALEQAAEAVASYVPDNNRSQRKESLRNTLYLDMYNANPSSMRAAVENFSKLQTENAKVVILGDMLELGESSAAEHRDILTLVRNSGFESAYFVGKEFAAVCGDGDTVFGNVDLLCDYLCNSRSISGAVILIKGSRGTKLERVEPLL